MFKGFKMLTLNGTAVATGLVAYFAQPEVLTSILSNPQHAALALSILGAVNMVLRLVTNTPAGSNVSK